MKDVRLVFPTRGAVRLDPYEVGEPGHGEVRVASTLSLMSTGTENIVFNGDFSPGTHFQFFGALPFHPGYLTVGEVDAVGDGVHGITPGDRVFHQKGHGSRFVLPETDVTPVPDIVTDEEAVWTGLAKVAFHAADRAPFGPGARIVIIGAGPVGQMTVRWAATAGCADIVVIARSPLRLKWAERGGATHCVQGPVEDSVKAVTDALGGAPSTIVDTTGNSAVLESALAMADHQGTVLLLGDTGHPGEQRLSSAVPIKGLSIIGVHDRQAVSGWDRPGIFRYILDLMARKRFDARDLITHRYSPDQAADAYATANESRGQTVGIAFNWS